MNGVFNELKGISKGQYIYSELPNYIFCQGPENYQNNVLFICNQNDVIVSDICRLNIDFIPEMRGMEIDHGPIADGLKVIRFVNHLSIHNKQIENLNNYQSIYRMQAISDILYSNFGMEISFTPYVMNRDTLEVDKDYSCEKEIHKGPIIIDKQYQWIPIQYRKGGKSNGDGIIIPNWLNVTLLSYQKWSIIITLRYRGDDSVLEFNQNSFTDIHGVIYYTPYIISILDILNDGMDFISVKVNLESSVMPFEDVHFELTSDDEIDPYHHRGCTFRLYEEIKEELAGRLYL